MKLTQQELKIVEFLSSKTEEFYENLAQFSQNPTSVKLKTIKNIVYNIKKKYKENNLPLPFNCQLKLMNITSEAKLLPQADPGGETILHKGQTLVKIKSAAKPLKAQSITDSASQTQIVASSNIIDFQLKRNTRQVLSRSGHHMLNDDEFTIFEYLFERRGQIIPLEELRDKVCFHNYCSKLPQNWWASIQRRINAIRRAVPETKSNILTVKIGTSTGYLFRS